MTTERIDRKRREREAEQREFDKRIEAENQEREREKEEFKQKCAVAEQKERRMIKELGVVPELEQIARHLGGKVYTREGEPPYTWIYVEYEGLDNITWQKSIGINAPEYGLSRELLTMTGHNSIRVDANGFDGSMTLLASPAAGGSVVIKVSEEEWQRDKGALQEALADAVLALE